MSSRNAAGANRVMVTGTGVISAIGTSTGAFGAALKSGQRGFRLIADDAGPLVGAYLDGADLAVCLDGPAGLKRSAIRVAGRSVPGMRAAVIAATQAWCDAGLHDAPIASHRLALVVAGNNLAGRYAHQIAARHRDDVAYVPGRYALAYQDTDHVGTLSQILGITGEGCTVGGASASGNVGIIHGSRLLELGAADACLVVGAMTDLSRPERQAFVNLGAMPEWTPGSDPAGLCRPFDAGRRGFVYGQAAACLVLEAEASARRRGAVPLAELGGYGLRLDANSLADPREEGEAEVMRQALARACLRPADVDYVNTHGTGSAKGDDIEVAAMARAFGPELAGPLVNATKGLTGHCLSAAGVVEAIAVIVQMRDGFIHPNSNLERPIDTRFRFAGGRAAEAVIDCALSNSFGFGGINTCIVLTTPGYAP